MLAAVGQGGAEIGDVSRVCVTYVLLLTRLRIFDQVLSTCTGRRVISEGLVSVEIS